MQNSAKLDYDDGAFYADLYAMNNRNYVNNMMYTQHAYIVFALMDDAMEHRFCVEAFSVISSSYLRMYS